MKIQGNEIGSLTDTKPILSISEIIQKQTEPKDHQYLAYLMQSLACLIWTSSYIYTNQHHFSSFQVNLAKGLIGTPLNYLVLLFHPNPKPQINPHSPYYFKALLFLNTTVLAYFYILPFSQMYLPLPIVHTIGCSSLVLTYLIDYFVNGVTITKVGGVGVGIGFLGVLLMANNRLILGIQEQTKGYYIPSSILMASLVALLLLLARTINCYGLVKLKSYPQLSIFELNLHNNIYTILTSSLGYMTSPTHIPLGIFWPSLVTIGIGQFFCMTCFFYSLKLTKKTGNVMVINALNLVVAFFISYFRYHQTVNWVLGGGAIAIGVGMVLVVAESVKAKAMAKGKQQGQGGN